MEAKRCLKLANRFGSIGCLATMSAHSVASEYRLFRDYKLLFEDLDSDPMATRFIVYADLWKTRIAKIRLEFCSSSFESLCFLMRTADPNL